VIAVGRAPDSLSVGVGVPVAVTVNVPEVPTNSVVPFELVIAGAWPAGLTLKVLLVTVRVVPAVTATLVERVSAVPTVFGIKPSNIAEPLVVVCVSEPLIWPAPPL
jgi:hypothetical protein